MEPKISEEISREKRSCGEEVGSEEEIRISGRGNFSSFLSLFGKGEVGRRKKDVLQQNSVKEKLSIFGKTLSKEGAMYSFWQINRSFEKGNSLFTQKIKLITNN